MSELMLKLKRKSSTQKELVFPVYFRVLFGAISLFTLIGLLGSGKVYVFPVVIIIICFLTSLYQEKWVFDKNTQEVSYSVGILFLSKTRIIPFTQIQNFEINSFVKGAPIQKKERTRFFQRKFARFCLYLTSGKQMDIETRSARTLERFSQMAQEIADLCDKPLTEDT